MAEERQQDRYSKGALAAVAASALVVGVAAGVLLWRRRAVKQTRGSTPLVRAPAPPPAVLPPAAAPVAAATPSKGWRARLVRDRTQRRLAKIAAAVILISIAFAVPVNRGAQPKNEVVQLTIQQAPRPEVLFGPDTLSKVIVDPRLEAGSTVRLRTAAPSCRSTLIGRIRGSSVTARSIPYRYGKAVATFPRVNPQGAVRVFDLADQIVNRRGHRWYQALLPMRPNGTRGWISAGDLRIRHTDYRIEVSQRALTLKLYRRCNVVHTYPIGLGKESTPTPVGRFYIISLLQPPGVDSVYGKWAYGLSAFSDAITNWTGGGVIGIHGTNDPSSVGQTVSHGCIRMQNEDIDKLVKFLPLGTPVRIGPP